MNSAATDIAKVLEKAELGLEIGNNLHVSREPVKPDNCITIYDSVPSPTSLTIDRKAYEYPAIQIRIRNNSKVDGWDMVKSIRNELHNRADLLCNDSLYTLIRLQNAAEIGYDQSNRSITVMNLEIQRRRR